MECKIRKKSTSPLNDDILQLPIFNLMYKTPLSDEVKCAASRVKVFKISKFILTFDPGQPRSNGRHIEKADRVVNHGGVTSIIKQGTYVPLE